MLPAGANWFDIVWLLAVLAGAIGGLRGGVLSELIRIGCWTLATLLAARFLPVTQWATIAGGVAGLLVLSWGIRKLVRVLAGPPTILSRLAGLALGVARMTALLILLTLALVRIQTPVWLRQVCVESRCGATVLAMFRTLPKTDRIQRTI